MMFKLLFPKDTDIPSPCKSPSPVSRHPTLTTTNEQQGMSPRLERALSEALEEELTQELTPILEPIMTRIKARIPAIIENCRVKLMRTSACSDDDAGLSPSVVSPCAASSDGEMSKVNKRSSPSRDSESSFEVVPTPKPLSSKAQGKRPQRSVPACTGEVDKQSHPDVALPDGSYDFGIGCQDMPSDMANLNWESQDPFQDNGHATTDFLSFKSIWGFGDDAAPFTFDGGSAPADTSGTTLDLYGWDRCGSWGRWEARLPS